MKRLALFASGSGSNAEKIVQHFASDSSTEITLIASNNPKAGVIDRARRGFGLERRTGNSSIPVLLFDRPTFYDTDRIPDLLKQQGIDLIALAGFMWLIPSSLIRAFPGKIINIHPALLPKFGGKGMYGHFVHEAVVAAGEIQSGITIHYVNEHYDEGQIIFQATCPVLPADTPDDVARQVQMLEHQHYPRIVAEVLAAQ